MRRYIYENYVNVDQESRWATEEEIKRSGTKIDVDDKTYPAAGLPLLAEDKSVWVDGRDSHTLIFGTTGSKKTRLFCMPMLNIMIRAGESFVATDPKGELYDRTAGMAKANGYRLCVLDFRSADRGDMWNPLYIPYRVYHGGNREKGLSMVADVIETFTANSIQLSKDPYWERVAASFLNAAAAFLVDSAPIEEANMLSLTAMSQEYHMDKMSTLARRLPDSAPAKYGFLNTTEAPEKTRQSIISVIGSLMRPFTSQKNMMHMLSGNTVDLSTIGLEKTALYIIIPDEKTTNHFLATCLIKQIYELMIQSAQNQPKLSLPIRVNFVLEEFCNLPCIPDMATMISAARSRNMRFFLIAQSLHQMVGRYKDDADTIKGNCENRVFLTSKELDLLDETSRLCGSITVGPEHRSRSLISISELQRLSKEKGEALIMHGRQYPIISRLPDIDDEIYASFKGYERPPILPFDSHEIRSFNIQGFVYDLVNGRVRMPFSETEPQNAVFDPQ